jgi:lysophospholipase L1-like esterase
MLTVRLARSRSFMNLVVTTLANDLSTSLRPRLITLWLGANDAALVSGPSKEQHVPLPTYKRNLHAMIALFKDKAPQAEVLLITPPAVDDDRRHDWGAQDRTNAATGEYARACVEVAREAGVDVLDLYTILNALPTLQWKGLLLDGLHLNTQGNHFMEQLLVETIKTKFPNVQRQLEQPEFPFDWLSTLAPSEMTVQHPATDWPLKMALSSGAEKSGSIDVFFVVQVALASAFVVLVGRIVKRSFRSKPSQDGEGEDTTLLKQ